MNHSDGDSALSPRAKLTIIVILLLLICLFLTRVSTVIWPFLWACFASYLLNPVVNYLNVQGRLPRIWAVALLYVSLGILLVAGAQFLYPRVVEQGTLFIEDIPRLEASIISLVGPKPIGIDVAALVSQLLSAGTGVTNNARNAGGLLVNAVETIIKVFLFLVTTFYLLMDAPRLKTTTRNVLPEPYSAELRALGTQINLTWQQYIRGELLLFAIMATVTTIGLTALQVPGAIFLGLASGALELLPLVGPMTAGALAVSVAYFNVTNPWGWSQFAYAGSVALMYFVLRQAEDYLVIPHVLGRAVRLHPLVVLFSVAVGGVMAGLFGLLVAVPLAASIKAISVYLYAKLLDLPVEFEPVQTLGGGVIEIPIHGTHGHPSEAPAPEGSGAP